MSVKHVKEYYNQICEQRQMMMEELRDFEEEARKGLFDPDRLDQIKETIRPLMDNYERWSYMMYLLSMPNKAEAKEKYKKTNEKKLKDLSSSNSIEAVIEENEGCIKKLKS